MSHQTSTINQPDNAWASYLKQQFTLLDLSTDVMSDQLGIGRATLYRMRSGQLLPRAELWQRMLQHIVLHPRSSLSWAEIQAWDAAWAELAGRPQPTEPYQLLRSLFEPLFPFPLTSLLHYLSNQPDDRQVLPLVRDYQRRRGSHGKALQELEQWLKDHQQQAARDDLTDLLANVQQTVAANQTWLAQHQHHLASFDHFVQHLVHLNDEMTANTAQLQLLVDRISAVNLWRDDVDSSISSLDQKIDEISLPLLWKRLRLAWGERWYGPLLAKRWQQLVEAGVGLLVLLIIVAFFVWLPAPYRDNPVLQVLLLTLLIVIVLWESVRLWVARELNAAVSEEPPTAAAPPPSPFTQDSGADPVE